MPKKKTEEEVVETANGEATEETAAATEETTVEASADQAEENAAAEETAGTEEPAVEAQSDSEEKPKKGGKKKAEATAETEETSIVDSVLDTAASVAGAVTGAVSAVAETVSSVVSSVTGGSSTEEGKRVSKRAERIGIVSSDKMTKTVTVRVDRQVKHPIYRKYIKRRKKFMAHDELGASIGDKVRIIETRPLSAKKRWRVVEIIQKAEK
jgi:ribosomal protein uS17